MFYWISLRSRIYLLLGLLVMANLTGALTTLWYTARTQKLYTFEIDQDIQVFLAADKLLASLVMQKGFVTYFFLDGESKWIDQLHQYHESFMTGLRNARNATYNEQGRLILNEIESSYIRFTDSRNSVIELYKSGKQKEGYAKHQEIRKEFQAIYLLCEDYRKLFEEDIHKKSQEYKKAARLVTLVAWGAIPGCVIIAFLFAFVLVKQVLKPIREMVLDSDMPQPPLHYANEVATLTNRMHSLVENVHQTQSKLEESRGHLIQSEKLALVGKMAAGVAHSIRNPLTSVKMRLFSLERSLSLNPTQKEDLKVISEEIRHIDTIVQNFLDFSRPPKLKFQEISPSDVVDMTLQLLKYRIESYGITIELKRKERLKTVMVDPDQLKEVLSNLILNAFDVMREGGHIVIMEEMRSTSSFGQIVVIQIMDDGPGIPESIQEQVFEPFFSTKEEGSGLGLSIAKRIVEEHNGQLVLYSEVGQGTTFEILFPCKEG